MTTSAIPNPVLGLLLHDVTDAPETSGFLQPTAFRYQHSVDLFRRYLDVVEASGLAVVTDPVRSSELSEDLHATVAITFDDGGTSAETAAGLLEERGWRGTFFVTTDLIGTNGFLTQSQLRDLDGRGHRIGSHSCSHPDVFRRLSRQTMRREWCQSRDVLQQLLGHAVTSASVPGGDCDAATIEEASSAGLTQVFTSEQLTKPWQYAGAVCFGRLMMLRTTRPETLQRWLKYPNPGILPERALRFTKSGVKRLPGPFYLKMMQHRRALHERS